MPKLARLELLQEARALDPTIPFLMLTVRTAKDAYITKPFKAQMFQTKIN